MKKTLLELVEAGKDKELRDMFQDVLKRLELKLNKIIYEINEKNIDINDCYFVDLKVIRDINDKRKRATITLYPLDFFDKDRAGKAVIYIKKDVFNTLPKIEEELKKIGFKIEKIYI